MTKNERVDKYKIIYTPWVVNGLINKGFQVVKTGINPNHPEYKTWYFIDSPQLQEAITQVVKKDR